MASLDFSEAIKPLQVGMNMLPGIAEAIQQDDLYVIADCFAGIARVEEDAFTIYLKTLSEFE